MGEAAVHGQREELLLGWTCQERKRSRDSGRRLAAFSLLVVTDQVGVKVLGIQFLFLLGSVYLLRFSDLICLSGVRGGQLSCSAWVCLSAWALELGFLVSNPGLASPWLCDLGPFTQLLCDGDDDRLSLL